jgi:hypothetical protein
MAQACCRKAAIRHLVTAVSKGPYSVGRHTALTRCDARRLH